MNLRIFIPSTDPHFIKPFLLVVSWAALSQLIMLMGFPIISRLYSPATFGTYAIFTAILYIFNNIAALGAELLIPHPQKHKAGEAMFWLALINVFWVTLVLGFLALIDYKIPIFNTLNLRNLEPYKWLMVITVAGMGVRNCLLYWFIRLNHHKIVGIARFIQSPIQITVQILIGYFYPHAIVLISAAALSFIISDVYLLIKVFENKNLQLSPPQFQKYLPLLKKNKKYCFYTSLSLLLVGLSNYLPILLFAIAFNPVIAAWYALAYQAFSPLDLISSTIIQLYVGEGNKRAHHDPASLRVFYSKMLLGLGAATIVPILILTLYAAPIFAFVFGNEWYQSGVYAQILAFAAMMRFIALSSSQNFAVLEKQEYNLLWSIFYILLILAAFAPVLFFHSPVTPELTITFLAIAIFIAFGILISLNFFVMKNKTSIEDKNLMTRSLGNA